MTKERKRHLFKTDPAWRRKQYKSIRKYKNKKYRNDAEYRRKVLASNAAFKKRKIAECPLYAKLLKLRVRVCQLREKINGHLKKLAKAEKDLMSAIKNRDALAKICRVVQPE